MSKKELKKFLTEILKKNGVEKASLFGSIARAENSEESDIDILIQFPKGKSLFDLIGLKLELEEVLHKEVDVLTYSSIHPRIRKYVLRDEELIYE